MLLLNSAPLPKSINVWVIVNDCTVGSTSEIVASVPFWLVNLLVSSELLLPLKVTEGKYELIEIFKSCSEIFKLSLSAFSSLLSL